MYKYPNIDKLLSRRTFLLGLGKGVLFSTIFFRLAYLQLFKSDQYKVLAEKNRISLRLIPPLRGNILDRNDNILALNKNSYNVLIEGNKSRSEIEETIEEMKKESAKGDPPIDIQTSSKGLIVNIKGDYAFPIGKASMKEELKGLLDEEIIPKINNSPFQVEVAGHSDSDRMPKKWRKNFATNWELSAARGASVVRYMIEKGIPAPRLLAAGYGPWAPHGLDSVKKANPMWNPLTLTWKDPVIAKKTGAEMPTVLSLNKTEKMKSLNRRIQITFLNPPHHGKGRSATSYEE